MLSVVLALAVQVAPAPQAPTLEPQRGARAEVSLWLGGEAPFADLGALERLPSVGGTVLGGALRYYPVDRLAVAIGLRGYLGFGAPASGTTAAGVLTPYAGVRWDLVRQGSFSLLTDVTSGPAFFVFSDRDFTTRAVGMEANTGLSARYSFAATTFELRSTVGFRVGEASSIGRPRFDVGPFSAVYLAVDLGVTFGLPQEARD